MYVIQHHVRTYDARNELNVHPCNLLLNDCCNLDKSFYFMGDNLLPTRLLGAQENEETFIYFSCLSDTFAVERLRRNVEIQE